MFCSKCGKQINDDASFCPFCGYTIDGSEQDGKISGAKVTGRNRKWILIPIIVFVIVVAVLIVSFVGINLDTMVHMFGYTVYVPREYKVEKESILEPSLYPDLDVKVSHYMICFSNNDGSSIEIYIIKDDAILKDDNYINKIGGHIEDTVIRKDDFEGIWATFDGNDESDLKIVAEMVNASDYCRISLYGMSNPEEVLEKIKISH